MLVYLFDEYNELFDGETPHNTQCTTHDTQNVLNSQYKTSCTTSNFFLLYFSRSFFFVAYTRLSFRLRLLVCTFLFTLQAPTEPAILLASWKEVLTDTSDADEGEGRARRWEGQVRRPPVPPSTPAVSQSFFVLFWLVQ